MTETWEDVPLEEVRAQAPTRNGSGVVDKAETGDVPVEGLIEEVPSKTDMKESSEPRQREGLFSSKWWIVGVLVFVALVVVAVTVPAVMIGRNDDDDNDNDANLSKLTTPFENTAKPLALYNVKIGVTAACESSVSGIAALHAGLQFPDHLEDFDNFDPVLEDGDFDVATYWGVLYHTFLAEGDVLEYVYHFDGMGGYPILYVRNENEEPFRTASEFYQACNGTCPNYLDAIVANDTPQSYMELVTLDVMGNQFYLWWHANYNDHKIICNDAAVEEIFREFSTPLWEDADDLYYLDDEELELLRSMDLTPTVEFIRDSQVVQVRVVQFTKWGGFYRNTYTIRRGSGEKIVDTETEILVPFDVGYVF